MSDGPQGQVATGEQPRHSVNTGKFKSPRWRVLFACLLFSLGFTLVFVLLGAGAGSVGKFFLSYRLLIARLSGILIILLGLFVMGLVKFKALYSERRFHLHKMGPFTAPLAGMAFAFGWTPCIGPYLGSLLTLAATTEKPLTGAFYLAIYSSGLALPFLLSALLLTHLLGVFTWIKRHFTVINFCAGGFLIIMGILMLTGRFSMVSGALMNGLSLDFSSRFEVGAPVGLITSFVAGLLSFLSPCVLPLVPGYLSFISGITLDDLMKNEVQQ